MLVWTTRGVGICVAREPDFNFLVVFIPYEAWQLAQALPSKTARY